MRNIKQKISVASALSLAVVGVVLGVIGASASSDHGISYSTTGAEKLSSSNVTINQSLVDNLTPLIKYNSVATTTSGPWRSGYMKETDGRCRAFKYLRYPSDFTGGTNPSFTLTQRFDNMISTHSYKTEVEITDVYLSSNTGQDVTIGIVEDFGYFYGGWQVYSDNECNNEVSGISRLDVTGLNGLNSKLFIDTNIKLKKGNGVNTDVAFYSDDLYFGLTDIDAAQSYMILNEGNMLEPSNMYAKNAQDLQPAVQPDVASMQMFNYYSPSGKYIFSQYNLNNPDHIIKTDNKSNIYVKLNNTTQTEGLKFVFGFAHAAASGLEYYAQQFVVNYQSDANGVISDGAITTEEVASGKNPSGSSSTPNTGYEFECWKADKAVNLATAPNPTPVAADTCMTPEQVKQVIVVEPLTFTAIHNNSTPTTTHTVTYSSAGNGTVGGATSETVDDNGNPTASVTTSPASGYVFDCWKPSQTVQLKNGSTVTAGTCMTLTDIRNVVVTSDLAFVAYFKTQPVNTYTVTTRYVDESGTQISSPNYQYNLADGSHYTTSPKTISGYTLKTTPTNAEGNISGADVTVTYVYAVDPPDVTYLTVSYISDSNGTINGTGSEQVAEGGNPSGRTTTPNNGYELAYWTANVDVTLIDGQTIPAGEHLTSVDVREVVVSRAITFEAHHEPNSTIVVHYEPGEHGAITDGQPTNEDVESGDNPSGSEVTPEGDYVFQCWTADKAVTLEDGTKIEAGSCIDDVTKVVVTEDLTFTAKYRRVPDEGTVIATPETGSNTKGSDAAQITFVSIFGVILCVLVLSSLPIRKKVKFGKK